MPTSRSVPSPAGALVPRHDRFADGSVKASGFELDGKLHGHWEWFRVDGSLMRSGEFDLGHQVGLWQTWDRAGRLVKETSFTRVPHSAAEAAAAEAEAGPSDQAGASAG